MSAWRNISIGDMTWPSWQTPILTNGWIFITSVSVLLIIVLQIRTWNFGSMSKILDILIQKVIYSYFTDWFSFFRSHVDLEYPDLDLDRDNWEVQVSSIIGPAHRPLQSIKVSLTLTMRVTASPSAAQHRSSRAGRDNVPGLPPTLQPWNSNTFTLYLHIYGLWRRKKHLSLL